MRKFSLPAPSGPWGAEGTRTVSFALWSDPASLSAYASGLEPNASGSLSWCGNHSWEQALSAAKLGDLSSVPQSDALLAKMERFQLPSTRRIWIDDVAGAFPNVPAFLSGSPLSMRRAERAQSISAPLAIIADLSTSAMISSSQTARRGAAILALVRALAAHRPIELWVLSGLAAGPSDRNACFVGCRLETSPLDLATASHCLTHVGFPRWLLYSIAKHDFQFRSAWPFSGRALSRESMEKLLAPAFDHVSETLCLPGLHSADESVLDPEGWLQRELQLHDPLRLEDAGG